VALKVLVVGSYSSAVARAAEKPGPLNPPVAKTWPFASSVTVCWNRGAIIEPVTLKIPVWAWAVTVVTASETAKIAANGIVRIKLYSPGAVILDFQIGLSAP
jgi:hypothetical protein